MATLVRFDGDGIAHGSPISIGLGGTGDTPVTSISGTASTMTWLTDDPDMSGCFQVNNESSVNARWKLGTDVLHFGVRFYFKLTEPTWPSSALHMASLYDYGTVGNKARFSISGPSTPGQVRFYDSAGAAHASASNVLAIGNWYRYEGYVKADPVDEANGQVRYLAYAGHGTTPLYDSGWNNWPVGIGMEEFWLGKFATTTLQSGLRYAHLTVTDDADTLIGPWSEPVTNFIKTTVGPAPITATFYKSQNGLITL